MSKDKKNIVDIDDVDDVDHILLDCNNLIIDSLFILSWLIS